MKHPILWNAREQAIFYRVVYSLMAGFLIAVGIGVGLVL